MLSSPAEGSSLFSHLTARPPTPPRDTSNKTTIFSPDTNKTVDDALRFLDEGHHEPDTSSQAKISTDTPPSKAPSNRGSTATKKVGFLLDATHQQQSTVPACSPRISHDSPAVRASGPLRSILKRSVEDLPPTPDDFENRLSYFSPQEPGSFRKMLQSVLKQLGGTSRDARRDAYLALNGALKQYSDLPAREALVEKMDLLQQFIARDMGWKDSQGRLDLQIVTQAVNLTSALLWDSQTAQALDDDFQSFIIDRSIVTLEQPDSPKSMIKAHIHILMMQHFPANIVTANKTERILTALQNVEEKCSGNSVIPARLAVYQRLATQQPSVMIGRMHDWMEHIFAGLLSSISDTRVRAIDSCNHIALHLGSYPSASKTLFEIFDTETDEGTTYCEHFNRRLMEMTSNKELAVFVPQIWAAIILFLRTKRRPIDRWPKLKIFLATIQRCLNSGDMTVKHYAHIAWNKLIFVVSPDSNTTPSMRSMLRLPIVTLLERRGNDRFSQQAKELALMSYNYLLHYGLRPALSHEDLDTAWKLYVEEVLGKLSKSGRRGQVHACRVLQGLLQRKKGMYNETAALESTPMKPEDLPQLDAKWIRSRLGKIIQALEPILAKGMCSPPEANEAANTCWQFLFQAVAEAGSQEVKASNELKVALAELINFFRRLWHASTSAMSEVEASMWLGRYEHLLDTCVETLGAGHFLEDFLASTNADEVEATPTPSNRTSKHPKLAYSPFMFLFALYYQPPLDQQSSEAYVKSAAWYLNLLAGVRGSASGTLGLLHRSLLFCADQSPSGDLAEQLWGVVVDAAAGALARQVSTLPQHNAQTVGVALRSALNIITFGLRNYSLSSTCSKKAMELYTTACTFAKQFGNDGGVALGVMEPLSKTLLDMGGDLSIQAGLEIGKAVLDNGVWPKNRQELEQSRKALWSVSLDPPSKGSASVFDPFDHIYSFLHNTSLRAYCQLAELCRDLEIERLVEYLSAIVRFLQRCPAKVLPSSLRRLQDSLVVFAEDRSRAIFPLSRSNSKDPVLNVGSQISSLWSDLLRIMQGMMSVRDSTLLESLEPMLAAGFASPSRDIVNMTITIWNETFGNEQHLEYPAKLLPVLRARRAEAELQLPGLSDDDSDAELAELPAFAESQLDVSYSPNKVIGRSPRLSSKTPNSLFNSPAGTPLQLAAKRSKSSKKSTPKARLRHDDSQLEFAPIESSSAGSAMESQLLTEHQKEVKARQHGDAQMFPELSSSPGPASQARRAIAKKLDFSSDAARGENVNEAVATPTGLADANPMSDDLPSSPTPRAGGTVQEVEHFSDDDATEIIDPPSSPPRKAEDLVDDDERVDETTFDEDARVKETIIEANGEASTDALIDRSDNLLPTAQLEREAAAAAAKDDRPDGTAEDQNSTAAVGPSADVVENAPEQNSQTPSRIEESFIEQIDEVASPVSNASTPRSRSKRKRQSQSQDGTPSPHKKARSASSSPLKQMWNRFTGNKPAEEAGEDDAQKNEDEDDDDVNELADNIIVASRPPVRSSQQDETQEEPSTESQKEKHIKRRRGRPRKSYSPPKESESQPQPVVEDQPQQPVKRGRGRPRKYPRPESSQASATSTAQKRRGSLISNATSASQDAASFVADTPAVPTTRKAARLSQGALDAGSSFRQTAAYDEDEEAQSQGNSALSPRRVLARLYGVLADIPKMVFGSQDDERAFDDVLFEMRRGVHDVGRRMREQQ